MQRQYTITITTDTPSDRQQQDVGLRLAKLCGLNFNTWRVEDDDAVYEWSSGDRGGDILRKPLVSMLIKRGRSDG